ncbi:hypothetical protein [Varunaivibrio sulfuroxidans]|uniref:Uncharacterized protein n=1 Tax=Varunaivibrio sulfuroxidans TaxID=1773489 RepID=A0A4R3J6S7_9PROT|nr:hypothetical protein [Varunaivibrio sulfuroxidans]TCS60160.1 hypothetical protein EDD55_11254 [Varunaivibrio sulfuroxidans]WES30870.1 hypothetical protein P3M64_00385 [Varunaivibrio sulfuroxidans]
MRIGIDRNNHAVYEGESYYGRALWPAPVLTPAKILFPSEGPIKAPSDYEPTFGEFMFREDSFDPVAGIRRGRFYENVGPQPREWHVTDMIGSGLKTFPESLLTYEGNPIYHKYFHEKDEQPIVCLGFGDRFTIWTIINIEATSTCEDLVTLKARRGLGVLPDLDKEKIPDSHRNAVLESLEGFVDEVHRSSPISVIDRARDAISQILLAFFNTSPEKAQDLGKMITVLKDKYPEKVIAISSADIVRRLHARAKPSEKMKRDLRVVREQDAEFATQCVGTVLCELGWAEWG